METVQVSSSDKLWKDYSNVSEAINSGSASTALTLMLDQFRRNRNLQPHPWPPGTRSPAPLSLHMAPELQLPPWSCQRPPAHTRPYHLPFVIHHPSSPADKYLFVHLLNDPFHHKCNSSLLTTRLPPIWLTSLVLLAPVVLHHLCSYQTEVIE